MNKQSNSQKQQAKAFLMLTVILTLIAAGLRFYNLGSDSFWLDEIFTLHDSGQDLAGGLNNHNHPPLFYLLVTSILSTVGESEFTVRYASAVAGILAVPLLAVFGKVIRRPRAGLWAAFLLTISPFHIRYSQEARHYAWLMTFSLMGYFFLYMALSRNRLRWWVFFALVTVLNLYTHYGAFLVLSTEIFVIAIWLAPKLWHRHWRSAGGPLLGGGIILLLYLPWIERMPKVFVGNTIDKADRVTPLATWLNNTFFEFGFRTGVLPYLTLAFCLAGLIILTRRRQWRILGIVLSIMVVPLFLISVFQVGRYAFPKYIIYILPVYLLAIGVALDRLVSLVSRRFPQRQGAVYLFGTLALSVVIGLVIWPTIRREYEYIERDWRGVADRLTELAQDGDIFLPMTFDLAGGFNQGFIVAPYYLDKLFDHYTMLHGNRIDPDQFDELSEMHTRVWIMALDRLPPLPEASENITVEKFAGSLYLIYPNSMSQSPAESLALLYDELVPVIMSPTPQCRLQEDLATLNLLIGKYQIAKDVLDEAIAQCPNEFGKNQERLEIMHLLLDVFSNMGREAEAKEVALSLLEVDGKDQAALETVTVMNLMQMFLEDQAEISGEPLPEPVEIRRFTMPHDGNWGDVLFLHPPGMIAFEVSLPESPTALTFKMALAPESWGWGGDGSTFVVNVQTMDGSTQTIFRQHVSNDPAGQDWHSGRVSLAEYAGQSIILTLATESGLAGDGTGDWAGWATPRIVWEP